MIIEDKIEKEIFNLNKRIKNDSISHDNIIIKLKEIIIKNESINTILNEKVNDLNMEQTKIRDINYKLNEENKKISCDFSNLKIE